MNFQLGIEHAACNGAMQIFTVSLEPWLQGATQCLLLIYKKTKISFVLSGDSEIWTAQSQTLDFGLWCLL